MLEANDGYFISIHSPAASQTTDYRAQWTLMKTDTAGAVLWRKMYGRTVSDAPTYTCYTQDGNILMTGQTSPPGAGPMVRLLLLNPAGDSLRGLSYSPFGLGRALLNNFNSNDRTLPLRDRGFLLLARLDTAIGSPIPVVLKVDAQLQPQWSFAYRPPIGGGLRNAISFAGMCELSDGSVLVLSANSAGITTNLPYTLLRLSPTGQLLNTYPLLSQICAQVQPHKLLADGDSAVYIFGRCVAGSPTFGELYTARIRLRGLPGIVTATATPRAVAGAVALEPPYPNPASSTATVAYRRPPRSGRAELQLTNMLGQVVRRWLLVAGGSGTVVLELGGLPAGVYLCALRVPGWLPATRRLVVAP
ncbi:T9SS type A sorting domain-containing protein [Hymenobacter sp. BT190]|uniref:T9SS type A sorting domain-containing protein n=1 Tax=Hymenobacter sp. BT190 TaxID=2763505 RepID=UPI0016512C98|nr:T9SS type A sorting domain-containing protein [Hymenobacter sp. BT190]MBC6700460.1 T9SS type A sorting domain-containing protein [Hymenobacter sp. BT190]